MYVSLQIVKLNPAGNTYLTLGPLFWSTRRFFFTPAPTGPRCPFFSVTSRANANHMCIRGAGPATKGGMRLCVNSAI